MPFYTSRGLKIRLDPDALRRVVNAAGVRIDWDSVSLDVEIWESLPRDSCVVGAIGATLLTHSAIWVLAAAFASYMVGYLYQQFTYSSVVNLLICMILGHWIIYIPLSIGLAVYLHRTGHAIAGYAQLGVVLLAWCRLVDLMLPLLLPVRVFLRQRGLIPPVGDMELAYIAILNRQASRQGKDLDWAIYDEWRNSDFEESLPPHLRGAAALQEDDTDCH